MEQKKDTNMRVINVMFNNDGRGNVTPKMSIPITWLRDMGVTPEARQMKVIYDEETKSFKAEKNK